MSEETKLKCLIYDYFDKLDKNGDEELEAKEVMEFLQHLNQKKQGKHEVTLEQA